MGTPERAGEALAEVSLGAVIPPRGRIYISLVKGEPTFPCEWPGRGIPGSRVEVDGAAIRQAADAAVTLWPDDPYCSHD
jgi:hypothetical protein